MDNYSWDIVYACSGNYINKQLNNNANKLIQSFEYEDAAVKIIGHFGAWKIVPGGGGSLLQFETPLTTGEVTFKQFNETIPLDGVIPLVEMQLQLVKGGTQQIVRSLVFNCTTVGKHKGDTASGAVTIINPDTSGTLAKYIDTHPDEAKLGAAMLSHGLGMIFIQNVDELNFVFASLLPVITSQNGDWISPATVTYAYQQPVDSSLGGIAIMGMLENVSADNLPRNFDPALLLNKDFGFVLSGMAFMKNVILPSLPGGFQGNCHINDFNLNKDGSITLRDKFNLDSVKVGLIYYTPCVTEINYHIDDTTIRCYVATQTDITGLTSAYVINTVTSNNPSEFNVATRTLSFGRDPNMSSTKNAYIPCWEQALGALLTINIMNLVIDAVSLAIQNSVGSLTSSKTAQSLGELALIQIKWSGQQSIAITAGGLADNVYMQGSLN
jgi:hypothetical protein